MSASSGDVGDWVELGERSFLMGTGTGSKFGGAAAGPHIFEAQVLASACKLNSDLHLPTPPRSQPTPVQDCSADGNANSKLMMTSTPF